MSKPLHPRRPVWDAVTAPHRLSLGLRRLRPEELWIDLDDDFMTDLAEKDRLFREHGSDVLVELPGSRDVQREVLDLLVEVLVTEFPDCYARAGSFLDIEMTGQRLNLRDPTLSPLELAARCVQEDLVVMEAGSKGWCLSAAAVCFPTRWELRPQLGRPMTEIHQRVPGYVEKLDGSSNQFFDGMKSGEVFGRGNWTLMDDPALYQPGGKMQSRKNANINLGNAGDQIWLRVEHQTLQRLPESNAILFGIRIHRTKLRDVASDEGAGRRLIEAIETMNPAMQQYKSLEAVRDVVIEYLNAAIASGESSPGC